MRGALPNRSRSTLRTWHITLEGPALIYPTASYPEFVDVDAGLLTSISDSRGKKFRRKRRTFLRAETKDLKRWLELLSARAPNPLNPESAAAGLHRGVRSLEFLERTVTKSNERAQRSS